MIKQWILSLLCLLWAGQTVLAGNCESGFICKRISNFICRASFVWMKFIATDLGPTVVRREQGGICGASG